MTRDPLLIVRLFGGLGNQLFQIAAAGEAERHYSTTARFVVDEGREATAIERLVGQQMLRATEWECFSAGRPPAHWPRWKRQLGSRVAMVRKSAGRQSAIVQRGDDAFAQVVWPSSARVVLDGHFMGKSIVEAGSPRIVRRIMSAAPQAAKVDVGVNRIAVHFRRGDFVRLGWALPLDYYEEALRLMPSAGGEILWIVSDDPILAAMLREHYERRGWSVEDPPKFDASAELSDFWTLAKAQHVIGATSTYSWWASSVGDAVWSAGPRVVIGPKRWGPRAANQLAAPMWRLV